MEKILKRGVYTCITELLCCIAVIKHCIYLYFNKKKMSYLATAGYVTTTVVLISLYKLCKHRSVLRLNLVYENHL